MPAAPTLVDHVRVLVRLLPEPCRPAHVIRHCGITVIAVDPRSTRAQITCWGPDHLTEPEMNTFRDAYDEPPVGQPLTDVWMSDLPFPLEVPARVRMTGTPSEAVA